MAAEQATFEIARMARLLGVSRSGFYDWARRDAAGPSAAEQRRTELTTKIAAHHADSDQTYGSPRILAVLREAGERVSGKTVAKLMRQAGIAGMRARAAKIEATLVCRSEPGRGTTIEVLVPDESIDRFPASSRPTEVAPSVR